MARKASVRYWPTRGGFCCWHQGKQVLLASGQDDSPNGPIYNAALRRFAHLVTGSQDGPTLGEVVQKYLEWAKHHREASTVAIRAACLANVAAAFGETPVRHLTPYEVQTWSDKESVRRKWSDGTTWLTLVSLQACLRWAQKFRLIDVNPLPELDMPAQGSRGMECVLSPEQEAAVIETAKGATRELVEALRDTGARPSEIMMAEAHHYDERIQAFVYEAIPKKGQKRHKTARSGKPRLVYLSGGTLETVKRLLQEHPTGPLFLSALRRFKGTYKGRRGPWSATTIRDVFKTLRRKTGFSGLVAYSFRHTYAVRWLRSRRPAYVLAEVMGTSELMLRRHYGHLAEQHDFLRMMVNEFHGERFGG